MYNSNNDDDDYIDYEDLPDFFENFDNSIKEGINPGYYEPDELCDIIDIYFDEGRMAEGKYVIDYALKMHPSNDEMISEILLLLNDYELWNDLLTLSEKYSYFNQVWTDGHKLIALLHLGMEEDAFTYFKKIKSKYAGNKEDFSIIYQAMAEALYDIALYDASIEVIEEALAVVGEEDVDLLWLELQSLAAIGDKENVIELGSYIQNLNPLDAETWSRLGAIYKEVEEMNKCIEAFEFAQSLGIDDPNNTLNLIYAYEKNGNFSKALQIANEYLNEYPDSYMINLLAINLCSEIENWSEGLKYVENAIKLEPQIESLYLFKCKFYLRLGENIKAVKALEEGIRKVPNSSEDLKKQLNKLNS